MKNVRLDWNAISSNVFANCLAKKALASNQFFFLLLDSNLSCLLEDLCGFLVSDLICLLVVLLCLIESLLLSYIKKEKRKKEEVNLYIINQLYIIISSNIFGIIYMFDINKYVYC